MIDSKAKRSEVKDIKRDIESPSKSGEVDKLAVAAEQTTKPELKTVEQVSSETKQSAKPILKPGKLATPEAKKTPDEKKMPSKNYDKITDDPLLGCLLALTTLHDEPFSARALLSGLPLKNNRLTIETFPRAAERAGLSAQLVKRPLDKIAKRFLPATLLLTGDEACVLLSVQGGRAQIIQPETGSGVREIDLAELEETYTGYALLVAKTYKFSRRSEEHAPRSEKNWFWRVVYTAWPVYSEVLVASFLVNLFALASPLFIMNVYDRVVPNNALPTLWVLAIGIALVFGFDFLMRSLRSYFIDRVGHRIDTQLSASIFEQLLGLKMSERPSSVGVLANNLQAFEAFRELITSATVTILVDLPFVFLFVGVIWMIAGPLAFVALAAIPLMLLAAFIIQMPLNSLIKKSYRYSAEKQAILYESLSCVEAIKTTGSESSMQSKWESSAVMSSKLSMKTRQLSSGALTFSMLVQNMSNVIVVVAGVYLIAKGEISMGALIACTILTGRALAPMAQLATLIVRFQQSKTALNSVNQLMQAEVERPRGKTLLHRPVLKGDIEFDKVSFTYPGQEIPAIHELSFKIKAGEKIGIIGRIGSGKTTIEKLLMSLYQPSSGTITIDGLEIQQLDPAELRYNIAYVPQDVVLFYGSIKDNIAMGVPHATDQALIKAVQFAGVERFINRHPQGFDMQVGERGNQLSGGQRQSVAIARSILLDPPILVFDEPSNSMDDRTESLLKAKLLEYVKDKTFVLTTHKGGMLSLVDKLLVMESGRMVAFGPKDKVLEALAQGKIKVT